MSNQLLTSNSLDTSNDHRAMKRTVYIKIPVNRAGFVNPVDVGIL